MSRLPRLGLLPRILLALLLGVTLGNYLPADLIRAFLTFNGLFASFLDFAIPLIILALVAEAIGSIGHQAGKMLLLTVGIAYGSTVFSGYLAYFTGVGIFPHLITPGQTKALTEETLTLAPYFQIEIPPVMGVMTALVLECKEIISGVIDKVIIPLLPLYIFGMFLEMTASGKVLGILLVFIKIIGIIFALHIGLLLLQYIIAGLVAKKNPLRLLLTMLPAYFTALGTASSAATIPVTLAQTRKNGVSQGVSAFVIPLCATIHLSGSMLKIVSCALALMLMQGNSTDFGLFTHFILLLGITMIAAPGVPGGAIMAALAILQSVLGFDQAQQALMISLYITMDSFGTACNVTGDGAIAVIIDHLAPSTSTPSQQDPL